MAAVGKDTLAGMASAISQVVAGHPLDTVKVKLQHDVEGRYRSAWDCVRRTVRQGGVRSLYRGMGSMIYGQQVVNVTQFNVYQAGRRALDPHYTYIGHGRGGDHPDDVTHASPPWHAPVAAVVAGVACGVVLTPVELVKVRLQAALMATPPSACAPHHTGPVSVARDLVAQGGVSGLFRGLHATVARESVGVTCWLTAYEAARAALVRDDGSIGLLRTAASGACGGASFWAVAFPLDTAKTRIQTGWYTGRGGVVGCVAAVVSAEGVQGLYRGWSASVVRAAFFVAPSITVTYELTRAALD